MAVDQYTNVYTAASYADRVDYLKAKAVLLAHSDYLSPIREKLQKQIETARQYEQKICTALHADDMNQLRERVLEYRDAVIGFSGPEIADLVNEYKILIDSEERYFSEAVNWVFENEILRNVKEELLNSVDDNLDKIAQYVLDYIKIDRVAGRNITFTSTKSIITDATESIRIDTSKMTKAQRDRWLSLIAQKMGAYVKDNKLVKKRRDLITEEQRQFRLEFENNQSKPNQQSMAWLFYKNANGSIKQIEILKEAIIQLAKSDAQPLIRSILDHILNNERKALYAGDNPKQITGILGEIQGMYYIAKLLGAKDSLPPGLEWYGGTHKGENNEKPHIDILINNLIGVQVKNSTKDLEKIGRIPFRSIHIEELLEKVTELPTEIVFLVQSYFSTKNFNVDYDIDYTKDGKKHFIHGGPVDVGEATRTYLSAKGLLNERQMADDIDRLMSLCLESFMYIKAAETTDFVDLNSLYLIGGATLYAVSEILTKLDEEIQEQAPSSFHVSSSYDGITIVESLNHSNRYWDKTSKNIHSDLAKGNTKTDLVIAKVLLTSSYNFSDLLNAVGG